MLTQRTGQLLKGRYRIHQLLHRGVRSTVYAGVDQKSGRVAIKVLDGSPDATQLRSSYLANAVGHPSAVNVLDTGSTEDGAVFLVMELLEATSMRELLRQHDGRLPVRLACTIADQGLDLLACAHAQGIAHGEIALDKLFFTRTERLKLLGFDKPQMAATGASEQACAEDVRALTRVIAELLHGEPVLTTQALRLPERIAAVLERGLSCDAALRWRGANAMRTALQLACQAELGRPVDRALRPLAKAQQARRSQKRSSRGIWFAASGALLVGIFVLRDLGPVSQPPAAEEPAESDVAPASSQPSEAPQEEAPAAPAPQPTVYADDSDDVAPPASASPQPSAAGLVPRKPAIPELRTPFQRRPGAAGRVTTMNQVCTQLRAARRSRSLSDDETEVWLEQCTKR
jgi:hypothetical protein